MRHSIDSGRWITLAVSLAAAGLWGCSGSKGSKGEAGASSLVAVEQLDAGEDCPAGGTAVRTGVDENGNGKLDEDEVTDEQILCDGQDGQSSLVLSESEPEGDNCVAGGTAVHTGIDQNGNGELDEDEIEHTEYVCNGVPGQSLLSLVNTEAEPAGDNCEFGGVAVRSGVDDNGDSLLQPSEVSTTTYACNSSGTASLVRQVDEEPGDNCTDGGIAVLSGMDMDGDGYLDDSEATQTSYVCHGAQGDIGKNGQNSLFDLEELAAGTDCAAGGFLVRSGLDANGDGELSDDEVQASQTLCNGGEQAIRVTEAAWGGVCAKGGVQIETGLDQNGNGDLEDSEVERTQYACNAAYASISAGLSHTCAVLTNGTVRCWGYNKVGQLGNGTTTDSSVPVAVSGLSNATAISAVGDRACALLTDGTARCWGYNIFGELGNGTMTDSSVPVAVSGLSNITALALGGNHTCALLDDGTVACWGVNMYGQLGVDSASVLASLIPLVVGNLADVSSVSAGGAFTCAVLTDGTARCWGANGFGELGNGDTADSWEPVTVTDLTGVTATSGGYNHTCAMLDDGTARCWGNNDFGQLGDESTTYSSVPVVVSGLSGTSAISTGWNRSCALLDDGTARCWGNNVAGELGNGTTTNSATPVAVRNLSNLSGISTGDGSTCAVLANGEAFCWGPNERGQLGDGTTTDSSTPVAVLGP